MSGTLAPDAPEIREFTATVERVDGASVELDETYFYAEAGGQPADRGTLDGVAVETVRTEGGTVVHDLAGNPDFTAGDEVAGVVDDDFRTYCMRAHTASHLLYGAGRRLLEDLGYGGFDISPEKVRVDFTTPTDIDDGTLVELERLVNRAVWDSLPVTWEELSVEEARGQSDIAFNTKTEEGVMADAAVVRVVTVEGWDRAACGGTHVSNTAEIGPVTLLSRSNPGEGMTRVEFSVGPPAVRAAAERHGAALATARELDSTVAAMAEPAAALRAELDERESELDVLRGDVVEDELHDLPGIEGRDGTWLVGSVSGGDANTVGERAEVVAEAEDAAVVAVVAGEPRFVVVASDGDVHAGDIVDELTGAFGGGGGGGPAFAQGGGMDADAGELLDWLRRYASEK